MISFSQQTQLYKLRKLAEQQDKPEVVSQIDALFDQTKRPDIMSREARIYEEEFREEQLDYKNLKDQSAQLTNLLTVAQEKNNPEAVKKILELKTYVDKEAYDYEDITEEIRGAGSAALESVSVGLLGDEAQAFAIAGLTGADYDYVLEDTRRVQREFAEDLPVLDLGIRLGTGLVPSLMLMGAAGVGSTFTSGALRQGGVTAGEIGLFSFLEGEGGATERLQNVGEVLTSPLGAGGVILGTGVGGMAGRSVGKAQALERSVAEAIAKEEQRLLRLREGKDETVLKDVLSTAQQTADNVVIRFYNQNGRMPQGVEIGQVYKQISEEVGVPIGRLMSAEMQQAGRKLDLDYRTATIADLRKRAKVSGDFVSEQAAIGSRGFLKDFYETKLEPIVEVAKRRIGPKAAGNMQRMATGMARQQQNFDTLFNSQPVQSFAKALEADTGVIKQRILNFANSNLERSVRVNEFKELKKLLTKEQMEGLQDLLRLRIAQAQDYRTHVFAGLAIDPLYFPSRTVQQTKLSQLFEKGNMSRKAADQNMMERTRGYLTKEEALDYENPLIVFRDKVARDGATIELHKNFKLENSANRLKNNPENASQIKKEIEEGQASFVQFEKALEQEGAGENVIKVADELLRSLIVRGTQSPSGWISSLRKAAYMGTIGNPYSALLNFGDVSNTVVNFGADNTGAAIYNMLKQKGIQVDVKDVGLINQASGEFLREGATGWARRFNKTSDVTFKYSGFQAADRLGKNVTLNAAVQRGREMAVNGTLMRDYRWLFDGPELVKLRNDLLAGEKTDRVREFAAAELAKLQPSDLAQMPKWYLDHPNGRILYMLRTFGLKQLQQLKRLVYETWKEGAKRNDSKLKMEAIKNAAAYAVIVGGGNTILNELRQPLKGKEAFDLDEMEEYYVDFMLGVLTLNTMSQYTINKAIEGDAKPFIMSVFPAPVSMAEDFVADTAQLLSGEKDIDELFFEGDAVGWLPFARVAQPLLEETFD